MTGDLLFGGGQRAARLRARAAHHAFLRGKWRRPPAE